MNKLKNSNEKQSNTIIILFVAIFLLLVFLGIECRKVERIDHISECIKICYPHEVDEDSSRIHCNCKGDIDAVAQQSE